MDIAYSIALRSKDESIGCGAVLVAKDGKQCLGLGFNGPPPRIVDTIRERPERLLLTCHAESNCLWFSANAHGIAALEDSILYVTAKPCSRCCLEIVRAKVRWVVYNDLGLQPKMLTDNEWDASLFILRQSRPNIFCIPFSSIKESKGHG